MAETKTKKKPPTRQAKQIRKDPNAERIERIMEGVDIWCSYYRANPCRFAKDYLHINLHVFQKILLQSMSDCTTSVFIGSRGIGKTYMSAVFCVVRAILYPGSKIAIASGTRGQALNVLERIMFELKPNSPELAMEIDEKASKVNGTDAKIVFKNTSYIKVVTASDSARGNRANLLILDEFRLIPKDVIDTILKKFLTQRRTPPYSQLTKEQKKAEYAKEKNKTLYLSSAYFVDHWSYTKCVDTFKVMFNDQKKQFYCALPYQLSIAEGMLDPDSVADEMLESDFNEIKYLMEYCAEWYGTAGGAFFDYNSISKSRRIEHPMLPTKLSTMLGNPQQLRVTDKSPGEIRVLSVDVALMSSRKNNNDASAIFLNRMMPTKAGRYTSNYVYTQNCEGLRTDDQALVIRKLFDEFKCDYIALDCNGLGLGVYDALARDIVDPDTGEVYPALSCCNNAEMASRCTSADAPKVIWAIKATAQFNSDCAIMLRESFKNGHIRLLRSEYEADESLKSIRGYNSLTPEDQLRIKMPYVNTTLLVDEMTKLECDENDGKVKIHERSGMRKDRYSSISYNNYVATQIENKMVRRRHLSDSTLDMFAIRAPVYPGRTVNRGYGRTPQDFYRR